MVSKVEMLQPERIVICLDRTVVWMCQRGSSHKYFGKDRFLFIWNTRTALF